MGSKGRILIVEDLEQNAAFLEKIMTAAGFEVTKASNGKEALAAVKNECPDLILLDIEMPVMDGIQACAELRKDPAHESIPIIMLTVKDQPSDIVRALEHGADDYVFKSSTKEELLNRIAGMLSLAKTGTLPSRYFFQKLKRSH